MQVSFRTIQLTDGKKRVNGALRARAAVRPALRQGSAFLLGLAGGWAVLYGALMPFGLGLTLGFAEDCFHSAVCYLPDYKWEDINGFTPEEMARYKEIIKKKVC